MVSEAREVRLRPVRRACLGDCGALLGGDTDSSTLASIAGGLIIVSTASRSRSSTPAARSASTRRAQGSSTPIGLAIVTRNRRRSRRSKRPALSGPIHFRCVLEASSRTVRPRLLS